MSKPTTGTWLFLVPKRKHMLGLLMRPIGSATLAEHEEVVARNKPTIQPKLKQRSQTQNRVFLVRKGVGTRKTKISDLINRNFKNRQTKDLAIFCYQKDKKVDDSFCSLVTN